MMIFLLYKAMAMKQTLPHKGLHKPGIGGVVPETGNKTL